MQIPYSVDYSSPINFEIIPLIRSLLFHHRFATWRLKSFLPAQSFNPAKWTCDRHLIYNFLLFLNFNGANLSRQISGRLNRFRSIPATESYVCKDLSVERKENPSPKGKIGPRSLTHRTFALTIFLFSLSEFFFFPFSRILLPSILFTIQMKTLQTSHKKY